MQVDKNESHIFKYLSFYKYFSVFAIIFGFIRLIGAIYDNVFRIQAQREILLNNQIAAASIVVIGMSYIVFVLLKIIARIKADMKSRIDRRGILEK